MFLPSLTPLLLCFLQVTNYPSAKSMLQLFCLYMVDAHLLLYMVERPIRRFTVLLRTKTETIKNGIEVPVVQLFETSERFCGQLVWNLIWKIVHCVCSIGLCSLE
jgi:hypothetical protein